jgi:hypothetical protein
MLEDGEAIQRVGQDRTGQDGREERREERREKRRERGAARVEIHGV